MTTQPTATQKNPLLQATNLSFAYDQDLVLKNISLDIKAGEFMAVIGPNGSGKSTLLKLLGGILIPDQQNVQFDSRDILDIKKKALATLISWIPQETHLAFPFKVQDVVMMGRHPYLSALTFEGEKDYQIATHAMELTETRQFAERNFNEISGGEKQRVLLASAIAQDPEVMLLDEPTSALDIKYQVEILNILKRLNKEKGTTLVLAMHDLHLASKFCHRLALLKEGKLVCEGTPREVLKEDILESVYGIKVKLFFDDQDGSILVSPELL